MSVINNELLKKMVEDSDWKPPEEITFFPRCVKKAEFQKLDLKDPLDPNRENRKERRKRIRKEEKILKKILKTLE